MIAGFAIIIARTASTPFSVHDIQAFNVDMTACGKAGRQRRKRADYIFLGDKPRYSRYYEHPTEFAQLTAEAQRSKQRLNKLGYVGKYTLVDKLIVQVLPAEAEVRKRPNDYRRSQNNGKRFLYKVLGLVP